MKHFVIIIVSIALFFQIAGAQNPYYDAIFLKGKVVSGKIVLHNDVQELLVKYFPLGTNSFDITASLMNRNPFFNSLFEDKGSDAVSGSLDPARKSFSLSSIGGLNATAFADGLAKFLIKRAKEELFISFFSKLQDDKQFPEFKILFPNSKILVDNFNAWEYSNIINSLREAFDKDIKQLLADIPKLRKLNPNNYTGKVKVRIAALTAFLVTDNGRLFMSALEIGNGLISGAKVPDVIHTIAGNDYLSGMPGATNDVKKAIRLLDIVSFSVKCNDPGKSYVTLAEFTSLMADDITRSLFLGLIWQQFKNENIKIGTVDLTVVLTPANINTIKAYIEVLINQSNAITKAFEKLKEAKIEAKEDLAGYWEAIFETADQFFQSAIAIQIVDPRLVVPSVIKEAVDLGHNALTIAHDIAVRNYNAVIVGILSLISEKIDKSAISGFKEFFVKYGSFAANVVQAKNSDEVAKAIESVALPVGSASIKKNTSFSIALNAYLGRVLR